VAVRKLVRRSARRVAPRVRRLASHSVTTARADAKERMHSAGALMIGGVHDPAEKAAERVADRVMRMAEPAGLVRRQCAECAAEDKKARRQAAGEEEEETVRARAATGIIAPGATSTPAPAAAKAAVGGLGAGRPLSRAERSFFEPRFGADLGQVRVHDDAAGGRAARALDARAFTLGQDIAFAPGERAPGTPGGDRLMAHELAHVTRQTYAADVQRKVVRRHSFQGCGKTETSLLDASAKRAAKALSYAKAVVGSAYGRPDKMSATTRNLLITNFHTTDRKHLRTILSEYIKIGTAFSDGVDFRCEKQCKLPKVGHVCGYAASTQLFGGFGDVHICFDPKNCDFRSTGNRDRDILLIHEVAHRYAGIDDKAYEFEAAYATLSAGAALDNADSYAAFAVDL
jgi:Domain of unknown function (DUF4157)/Lysine-specific metallo-endopeptidase